MFRLRKSMIFWILYPKMTITRHQMFQAHHNPQTTKVSYSASIPQWSILECSIHLRVRSSACGRYI